MYVSNSDPGFGATTWEMNLTIANPTAQDIWDYNKARRQVRRVGMRAKLEEQL
jgi:hypothetical protein